MPTTSTEGVLTLLTVCKVFMSHYQLTQMNNAENAPDKHSMPLTQPEDIIKYLS